MKKLWLLLAVAVLLRVFGLSPFQTTNLARLCPVQTMVISESDGRIRVDCGEKLLGSGETLNAALEDLKARAEGEVFLGTVQQILLCRAAQVWGQLTEVSELRPAAELYQADMVIAAVDVTAFLQQHKSGVTLLDFRAAQLYGETVAVPWVIQEEGGYYIDSGKPG